MALFNDSIATFNDSVVTFNSGGTSGLAAPVLLSALVSDSNILLTWALSDSATGYKVKYGTSHGSYTVISDVGNVLTISVSGLLVNQFYYFVVSAYDGVDESVNSNELRIMISQITSSVIDLDSLLEYYVNLLIVQYKILPKARGTIKCLVNNALCDGLPLQLQTAFNLETATGNQLTIIGKIVGVSRNVYGLDLNHTFFNFTRYSGVPASNGFNRWTTPTDPDLISRWKTTAIYTLTDFEMRALIHLKIIYNNAYESLGLVKNDLYEIFGGAIDVVDNADCTITYNIRQPYHNVALACSFLGNILPKPAGVGITINQV